MFYRVSVEPIVVFYGVLKNKGLPFIVGGFTGPKVMVYGVIEK